MIKRTYHLPGTMLEHIFFDTNCSIKKIVKNDPVFRNVGLTVEMYSISTASIVPLTYSANKIAILPHIQSFLEREGRAGILIPWLPNKQMHGLVGISLFVRRWLPTISISFWMKWAIEEISLQRASLRRVDSNQRHGIFQWGSSHSMDITVNNITVQSYDMGITVNNITGQ